MEQVVVTVEALRCYRCRRLMHPSEPFFQHEMMSAVSVSRHDTTHTYTWEDVCEDCHVALIQAKEEERRSSWWWWLWFWAFFVNAFCAILYHPINLYPFWGALAVRSGFKWWGRLQRMSRKRGAATRCPLTMRTVQGSVSKK